MLVCILKAVTLHVVEEQIVRAGGPTALLLALQLAARVERDSESNIMKGKPGIPGLKRTKPEPAEEPDVDLIESMLAMERRQSMANAIGPVRGRAIVKLAEQCLSWHRDVGEPMDVHFLQLQVGCTTIENVTISILENFYRVQAAAI